MILVDTEALGYPTPLARARHGNGKTYDPAGNVAAKDRIRWMVRAPKVPTREKLRVELTFMYTRANPTADIDNLCKMIFDAFNKYIWHDDSQVVELHASKAGSCTRDSTVIHVSTIAEEQP